MADKYRNFLELAAAEPEGSFSIHVQSTGSKVAVAAPHGGGIELGTSEIARAIAGHDLSCYVFEGEKSGQNRDLHITSTNFDEPQCIELLSSAESVLTIHGEGGNEEAIYIGGCHQSLAFALQQAFEKSGFIVRKHANPSLQGKNLENICNIGRRGAGVQLELSRGLRLQFFGSLNKNGRSMPTPRLAEFCECVRQAIG